MPDIGEKPFLDLKERSIDPWRAVSALNLDVNHFPSGVMPKVLDALEKDRARRLSTTKGPPTTKADGK